MVTTVASIEFTLNFDMNEIMICWFHSQMSELYHIVKELSSILHML